MLVEEVSSPLSSDDGHLMSLGTKRRNDLTTMYQEQRRELERAESEMSQRFDAAQKISDQLLDDSMSHVMLYSSLV